MDLLLGVVKRRRDRVQQRENVSLAQNLAAAVFHSRVRVKCQISWQSATGLGSFTVLHKHHKVASRFPFWLTLILPWKRWPTLCVVPRIPCKRSRSRRPLTDHYSKIGLQLVKHKRRFVGTTSEKSSISSWLAAVLSIFTWAQCWYSRCRVWSISSRSSTWNPLPTTSTFILRSTRARLEARLPACYIHVNGLGFWFPKAEYRWCSILSCSIVPIPPVRTSAT